MSARAEAIIVGLGAMGSAACASLAGRGVSVLGIDQFTPPHPYGSTHGETRITRLAIGEGAQYVPLVRRSHELWREIEQRSGTRLLTQCGGLIVSHPASPFYEKTVGLARRFGIEHEQLDNAELRRRYPMFAVDDETEAYFEPEAGRLAPEAAVGAQLELARCDGARLALGERVTAWTSSGAGVEVSTDAGRYSADRLILCAGAWLPGLFPESAGAFAVYRQLMHWFAIREGHDRLRDMPVWVWEFGGERPDFVHLDGFYGFPAVNGPGGGVKIGTETYETTSAPDGGQHPAGPEETAGVYRNYVAGRLPWLSPESLRSASCLYTSTRDNRFVIDRHPDHESVLVVSACSGHGFKHSPAIGELVAGWVTGSPPPVSVDLEAFRLAHVIG